MASLIEPEGFDAHIQWKWIIGVTDGVVASRIPRIARIRRRFAAGCSNQFSMHDVLHFSVT
jgi:hypothetical protein